MPKRLTTKKKPAETAEKPKIRQLFLPKRRWYNPLTWRFSPPVPDYKPLPKARHLFMTSLRQVWQNRTLFGGIVLVYGILNIALVRGLSNSNNLEALKTTLDSALHGFGGKVLTSLTSFGYLLATSGSGSLQNSTAYQYILLLFCSLAFIWALRKTLAKQKVTVRDSFYQGMYPLVPFLFVFLILGVQLIPIAGGGGLYALAVSTHIAVVFWEKALLFLLFAGLAIWSLRMVTATIFAVYIVTLPNTKPVQAVRSAKELVYGRRLLIWRKILFLPVILLVLAAIIEIPLIFWLTPVAPWMFFLLSMMALPIAHSYLYNLYREML
jgi:hypothetical protein